MEKMTFLGMVSSHGSECSGLSLPFGDSAAVSWSKTGDCQCRHFDQKLQQPNILGAAGVSFLSELANMTSVHFRPFLNTSSCQP